MPTVTLISENEMLRVHAEENTLLADFLQHEHAPLAMPCAGKGRCGKCRVKASGALSPVTAEEKTALRTEELNAGIRLACCARIVGDAQITLLAAAQLSHIRVEGMMPAFAHEPMFKTYGAAIDIGTTTLAAQLYSANGAIASATAPNPQSHYGADVISRIGQALDGKSAALAACVQNALSDLLQNLAGQAGITTQKIDSLVVTGNTAMLYLLTQRNPDCLSHAPFCADTLFGDFISASELHLPCPDAQVYLPRCMSAFVGADITTALLASDICAKPQTALLADIGTNGEMVLWHDSKLLCCSTAAGPAFEGAGLSMGMQGAAGAIDHVALADGAFQIHTIGEMPAKGICGSGIVDALAAMTQAEVLEESGLLSDEGHAFEHLVCEKDDETVLMLTDTVFVSQKDVRMVQLAKSAVCAGMHTLLDLAKVSPAQLDSLCIAGGFGSYLDLGSAARIGLYPAALQEKAIILGNAALSGAAMILQSRNLTEKAAQLAAATETIELSTSPLFMDYYMDCMMF